MNTVGSAPYIMSSASVPHSNTDEGTGGRSASRLAEVALMTMSNTPVMSAYAQADTTPAPPSAENCATNASAVATVRLAMTSCAGRCSSIGSTTPRAAPPAPSSSTRLPVMGTPALLTMSATSPAPSVLSPMMPSSLKCSVLTAPAACAYRQRVGHAHRFELERDGDVGALAAFGDEGVDGGGEAVERRQAFFIDDLLAGLERERGVDGRRFAVGDRVAEDAVLVHQLPPLLKLASIFSSCVNLKRVTMTHRSSLSDERILGGKGPNGPERLTMASALASSAGLPELRSTCGPPSRI